MGPVEQRSTVTLDMCLRHARMNPSTDDDGTLDILVSAIKKMADDLCCNPFVLEDEDGEPILDEAGDRQPQPIPPTVELWIMRKFARINEYRLSGNNDVSIYNAGQIKLDRHDYVELLNDMKFR